MDSVKDIKDSLLDVIKNTEVILSNLEQLIQNSINDEDIRSTSMDLIDSIIEEYKKLNLLHEKTIDIKTINLEKREEE